MEVSPFNPAERYKFEDYIYSHKKNVLGALVFVVILLLGLMFFVWWSGHNVASVPPVPWWEGPLPAIRQS